MHMIGPLPKPDFQSEASILCDSLIPNPEFGGQGWVSAGYVNPRLLVGADLDGENLHVT